MGRLAAGARDCEHCVSDGALVGETQRAEQEKRWRHMQRRRQWRSFDGRNTTLGVREIETVVKSDFVVGADSAVKIGEVRAAAEGDVLAIVYFGSIRQCVRSGATPEMRTLFYQRDAPACFSQRDGGRKPRQSAADYENALRGHPFSTVRSFQP